MTHFSNSYKQVVVPLLQQQPIVHHKSVPSISNSKTSRTSNKPLPSSSTNKPLAFVTAVQPVPNLFSNTQDSNVVPQ